MRMILAALGTVAVLASSAATIAPAAADGYFHDGGWRGGYDGYGWRHHDGYRDYGYRHGWRHGDAIGAGLAGLAVGTLVGGALTGDAGEPVYSYSRAPVYEYARPIYGVSPQRIGYGHVAACEARYRSYNPRTDTYLSTDGTYHACHL